jgi:hypothetical protein
MASRCTSMSSSSVLEKREISSLASRNLFSSAVSRTCGSSSASTASEDSAADSSSWKALYSTHEANKEAGVVRTTQAGLRHRRRWSRAQTFVIVKVALVCRALLLSGFRLLVGLGLRVVCERSGEARTNIHTTSERERERESTRDAHAPHKHEWVIPQC